MKMPEVFEFEQGGVVCLSSPLHSFKPDKPIDRVLVFFHGFTSYAQFWRTFVDMVDHENSKRGENHLNIKIILIQAPLKRVILSGGAPMPAFYEFFGRDQNMIEDVKGIDKNNEIVKSMLEKIRDLCKLPDFKNFRLVGFSQGGAVAMLSGITGENFDGKIAGLSTYFPDMANKGDAFVNQPKLMYVYSKNDPVLLQNLSEATANFLRFRYTNEKNLEIIITTSKKHAIDYSIAKTKVIPFLLSE